jgi:hypothetical protein
MSQGNKFVLKEVRFFVTDSRPFSTHEELKINALMRLLHKYGEVSASTSADSIRLPYCSHVSFCETLEQFRQFILHFISCIYSAICL